MKRYQLRIRAEQPADAVIGEIVDGVWPVLASHHEFDRLGPGDREKLRVGLKKVLGKYVSRYDTCGLEALCEEAVEPAEWNSRPDPALGRRHPWQADEVKRLVVDVEKGLEELVDALEAEVFRDLFAGEERAKLAKSLRAELGNAIRGALGPHLYRSVSCGMLELCREGGRVEPWG